MLIEKNLSELLANISPAYHEDFQKAVQENLYAGEVAFFATDYSSSRNNGSVLGYMGVMLFTDRYCLQIKDFNRGYGISYYKHGSFMDKLNNTAEDRRWVHPQSEFKAGYYVKLPVTYRISYDQINGIVPHHYQVVRSGTTFDLLELRVDLKSGHLDFGDYIVFKKEDGELALQLLLQAQSQNGKITTSSTRAN